MPVLCCHLGCQWLLSVTALMWQLWVAYFSKWRRMEQVPRAGKHWNISPTACQGSTTKKVARVSIGTDSPSDRIAPFWNCGIHTHFEAGLGACLSQLVPLKESASRVSELLERYKNLRDPEKLSWKQCKSLLKALFLKRETQSSWTSEFLQKRRLKPETAQGLHRKNFHNSHACIWPRTLC